MLPKKKKKKKPRGIKNFIIIRRASYLSDFKILVLLPLSKKKNKTKQNKTKQKNKSSKLLIAFSMMTYHFLPFP